MSVIAAKTRKTLLLTGTLIGGYASDLFYLLFRALPERMIEDGYRPSTRVSMNAAAMAFMRDHGVLKDIYSESDGPAHKTAKGSKVTVRAPGFGPKGVLRCVLPFTIFLKLRDIGGVLPPNDEEFREVEMDAEQSDTYSKLSASLTTRLKEALRKRDTTSRLKMLLEQEGFKVEVLRANVDASRREDWIAEQLDRGIDVLITNPELVKTGLDLLEFPTIVFMQSGYNVYTLQQASRRSWRIGQKQPVKVIYLGYAATSQMTCLALMAKKILVSQSTSGGVPESGLEVLNQDDDSIEVALARQLVAA